MEFLSTPSARRATTAAAGGRRGRVFLSTPSARRATPCGQCVVVVGVISIHALREEGDSGPLWAGHIWPISIHALREEGDCGCGRRSLSTR